MIEFLTPTGLHIFDGTEEDFLGAAYNTTGVLDENGWRWKREGIYAYRPMVLFLADEDE